LFELFLFELFLFELLCHVLTYFEPYLFIIYSITIAINQTTSGKYLIAIRDGASIAITRSVFSQNVANAIIDGELQMANVMSVDSCQFTGNHLTEYAIAGRFTKSSITNSAFSNQGAPTQLAPIAPGDLMIQSCQFTAQQSFSSIANKLIQEPLTLLLNNVTFYGYVC
jgi:hypothetical protein